MNFIYKLDTAQQHKVGSPCCRVYAKFPCCQHIEVAVVCMWLVTYIWYFITLRIILIVIIITLPVGFSLYTLISRSYMVHMLENVFLYQDP